MENFIFYVNVYVYSIFALNSTYLTQVLIL